jgi:hypothetical protein
VGLFGGSSSSSSNLSQDQRQTGGDGSVILGAGASAVGMDEAIVRDFTQAATATVSQGTDAVKTLAGFTNDQLKSMGDSVTHLYDVAGSNMFTAYEHTLDQSAGLLKAQTDTAGQLAQAAVIAANPQQGANDTLVKLGMYLAIGLVAYALLKRKKGA